MGLTSNTGPYNAAAEHFGADDPVFVKTPRLLYNFSIQFLLNDEVFMEDSSFGRNFTFNRVVSVSMPDYDYGIQPINQYNRMRYVPTRMTPGPATVVFYDTKDNQFQSMMKAYAGHYFHGHDLDTKNFNSYDILGEQFASGAGHEFGAKTISPSSRHFYEEIRIHNKDTAQGGRTTVLYNCMVDRVQHSNFDYGMSGASSYTVQFTPEHVNIGAVGTEFINEKQALRQSLQSDIPGTVANRAVNAAVLKIAQEPAGSVRPFTGTIKPGEALLNIDGDSFVINEDVQLDQLPQE